MSESTKRNIVIVGGSLGAHVARDLSRSLRYMPYNIILVDARPCRLNLIATARMIVSETDHLESEDAAFVPYDRLFQDGNGTFICGKVCAVERNDRSEGGKVVLQNGETVDFHVLVLATGSLWSGPFAIPDSSAEITTFLEGTRKDFKDAQNVVLLGGGPVAVELAGEIRDEWPDKDVTIVHRRSMLLTDRYPDKFRLAVAKNLECRRISLLLNDSIEISDLPEKYTSVVTKQGNVLSADLVLPIWGTRPNTDFIASSPDLGPEALTDAGCVRVKPTLQLPDHPDIFALGDMIDWAENKQALTGIGHTKIVSANVVNYLQGKSLKEYKGATEVLVLTGGKNDGIGYLGWLWGIMLGAWFVRPYMSRNLAIPQIRKYHGY